MLFISKGVCFTSGGITWIEKYSSFIWDIIFPFGPFYSNTIKYEIANFFTMYFIEQRSFFYNYDLWTLHDNFTRYGSDFNLRGFGDVFLFFIKLLLIVFIIDIVLYFLGRLLNRFIPEKYKFNTKYFYTYFKFIPILGAFTSMLGAIFSKQLNIKKDFIYMFVGAFIHQLVNILFWFYVYFYCFYFNGF